ncbi:envelope glycoprotein UL37 [Aotine betaherpesvirus 1]|uniref:Envelope glycoprotein UL37 n=1 Tax=Aotine betaherpesvirus 1 TaxID=50290 RepID=G8XUB2_9BETA|nr:envelope glycoprotein UL37 [Aotine betaherpesvirus 1]AEV80743.1 envelope glycoprotein UL37 [Aotine betaherpesvirus 1]
MGWSVKPIDVLGVAGFALFCYASYMWIDWKKRQDPFPWLTKFKRELERRRRRAIAGMYLLSTLATVGTLLSLDCEFRTCVQERERITTSGCYLDCVFNETLIFRGPCDRAVKTMRLNMTFPKPRRLLQGTVLNAGLRYYLEGHVLLHLEASLNLTQRLPGRKTVLVGHFVSSKDSSGTVNGTFSLNLQGLTVYNFSSVVNRTYNSGIDRWTAAANNSDNYRVEAFLNSGAETDFEFLKDTAHRLINKRMKRFAHATGQGHLPRPSDEEVCRLVALPSNWRKMWTEWTKYTPIPYMECTRVVIETVLAKDGALMSIIGLCIIGSGMSLMIALFCLVVSWRRHDIIRDLRKKRADESPIFFTKASGDV